MALGQPMGMPMMPPNVGIPVMGNPYGGLPGYGTPGYGGIPIGGGGMKMGGGNLNWKDLALIGFPALVGLGSNIFRPRTPSQELYTEADLVNPIQNQYNRAAADLDRNSRINYERELANQRAAGITGSGGVQRLRNIFDNNNDARIRMNALAADKIAEATAQQNMLNKQIQFQNDMLRYGDLNNRFNSSMQGVSDIFDMINLFRGTSNPYSANVGAYGFQTELDAIDNALNRTQDQINVFLPR